MRTTKYTNKGMFRTTNGTTNGLNHERHEKHEKRAEGY